MSTSRNNQEPLTAKMQEAFNEYIKEDGKEPMYAICRIKWLDDGSGYDVKIKLSVEVKPETDDEIILLLRWHKRFEINDCSQWGRFHCNRFLSL